MKRLIILGAGGYARTINDIATQSLRYDQIFYLDDNKQSPEILGKCSDFEKFISEDTEMYPAIGDNQTRLRLINLLKEKLDIPFLFLAGGECKIHRRIGGEIGSCMSLCVYEHDELATKSQPLLRDMKLLDGIFSK